MSKNPYKQTSIPLIRTLHNPYTIPLQGVLTFAHVVSHEGMGNLVRRFKGALYQEDTGSREFLSCMWALQVTSLGELKLSLGLPEPFPGGSRARGYPERMQQTPAQRYRRGQGSAMVQSA